MPIEIEVEIPAEANEFEVEVETPTSEFEVDVETKKASATEPRSAWHFPYLYLANAPLGTAEDFPGWKITRVELDAQNNKVAELHANNVPWEDYLTVTYS